MKILNDKKEVDFFLSISHLGEEYYCYDDKYLKISVLNALNALKLEVPDCYRCISKNVKKIILLDAAEVTFASTTFFETKYCIFLTKYCCSYIPPDIISNNEYCIKENIYHEALHQELFSKDVLCNLINDKKQSTKIYIPWRNQHWFLPQAFHAFYVYTHISILRNIYFKKFNKKFLKSALIKSKECTSILFTELLKESSSLSKKGISLMNELYYEYEKDI